MRFSGLWKRGLANGVVAMGLVGGSLFTTLPANAQESALVAAKDRVQKAPTSAEASIDLARALRRAGRETEALTELRRGQPFAKGEAAVMTEWEIARTYIARRDFATALRTCQGLASRPSAKAAAHVCAAEAHLLWRRGSEALSELAAYAKLPSAGTEVDYFAKLAEGRSRELDSKDADAEAAYRDAIRLAPERIDAHVLLGTLLQHVGKDGLPELRRAADLDPRDPVAEYALGRVFASNAMHPDAIGAFERAVAERPSYVEALRGLTESYVAANRLDDARRTAAAVLRVAPNDVSAHLVSGRVAFAEGKYAEARSEGAAALKLMPNEAKANLLIADAYAKEGEIDLALEAYQKASGLDPLDPTALIRATSACLAAGRFTSAKAFGERAVLDFPNQAASWVAKGDALAADGNPSGARSAYESARKTKGADQALIDGKLSRLK